MTFSTCRTITIFFVLLLTGFACSEDEKSTVNEPNDSSNNPPSIPLDGLWAEYSISPPTDEQN